MSPHVHGLQPIDCDFQAIRKFTKKWKKENKKKQIHYYMYDLIDLSVGFIVKKCIRKTNK